MKAYGTAGRPGTMHRVATKQAAHHEVQQRLDQLSLALQVPQPCSVSSTHYQRLSSRIQGQFRLCMHSRPVNIGFYDGATNIVVLVQIDGAQTNHVPYLHDSL